MDVMRNGRAMVAASLLSLVAVWPAGGAADVARDSAWSRGLALFKQSKFRAACALLSQAAAAAPDNGAIWADLGLCELKRGDKASSIHASLLATRSDDERVRKNAYFNLYLAGHELDLPAECGALVGAPELACQAPAFACSTEWRAYGSAEGNDGSVAVFAATARDAEALRDDVATSDGAGGAGQVPLSEQHVCFPGWCHMHAWSCEQSAVVARAAMACFRKATGSSSKDPCGSPGPACETLESCRTDACSAAEDTVAGTADAKPWPALEREFDEKQGRCASQCAEGETFSCSVVVVDPCRNRIGYVCAEPRGNGKAARVQASEVAFSE